MRITNQMINNNMIHTLNRQKEELQNVEQHLSTGSKIQLPSDDPVGSTNQMLLRSRIAELNQYDRNVNEGSNRLNLMDGELSRVGDILQRMRYLTVQAANGTNRSFELKEAISKEINQHLRALVDIANVKDATGRSLFGGSVIERNPFRSIDSHLSTSGVDLGNSMIGVQYQGDIIALTREIEKGEIMEIGIPGNRIFWGTNTQIASNQNTANYVALGDQSFKIDGIKIDVSSGDTINDIIDRINSSGIEVQASKGNQDDIILTSKTPHEMWLEDFGSGTVLQDLGLVDGSQSEPPGNYHPNATTSGLSIFDVAITLRDDLIRGDHELIGGRDLEALDLSLDNILRYRSEIGARVNRLEQHTKRISWDTTYTQDLLAHNESTDIIESTVRLKWLEHVHNYALRVGANIIKPTLMDFLR